MKLNKWNYKTKEYDVVEVPEDYECKSYTDDMSEIVNCPHCGGKFMFGQCYTSMEFHTSMGFGYAVCESCYEQEVERRMRYESDRNR